MGKFTEFVKNNKESVDLDEDITFSLHQDSDGDHYAKVYHNGKLIHRTQSNRSQTTAKQYGDQAIAYFNSEEGKKHLKESEELEEAYKVIVHHKHPDGKKQDYTYIIKNATSEKHARNTATKIHQDKVKGEYESNVYPDVEKITESVENHAFLQQSLADKDINSKIENGKVVVHKDNVAKAKAHVKKLGHTVSVVSGLNEEELNEDDTISHVLNLKGHMQDAKESNNPKMVTHYLEKLRKLHGAEYSTNVYRRAQSMMKESEELNEERAESPTKGTRKIASYGDHSHTAEVRYNSDWQEYQVHHYKNGKHLGEGPVSYHGDDKQDAHGTAKYCVKHGIKESEELDEANMAAGWSPREMKKHLLKHGFEFKKNGGAHDIYYHPKTKEDAALPRHNQDLATGTAKQLLDKVKRAQQVNESSHSSSDYKVGKDGRKYPASRITFKEYSGRDDEKDESEESKELKTKILRAKNGQRAAKALGEEYLDEVVSVKYEMSDDGMHVAHVSTRDKHGNTENHSYSSKEKSKLGAHIKKTHGHLMKDSKDGDMGGLKQKSKYEYVEDNSSKAAKGTKV